MKQQIVDSKCPICDKVLNYSCDYTDFVLLQEHFTCPNQHYFYSFEHGACSLWLGVGNEVSGWNWYYTETSGDRKVRLIEIQSEIERQRKLWFLENEHSDLPELRK